MPLRKSSAVHSIDPNISWPEHFVRFGFCVLPKLVDDDYCEAALEAIRRRVGDDRPLCEWTTERPGQQYDIICAGEDETLDGIWHQPRLAAAMAELFGGNGCTFDPPATSADPRRHISLWLNPYDEAARPRLLPLGHIDSGDPYRGVSFQLALVTTEAFSGNTTFFPQSHVSIYEHLSKMVETNYPGGNYVEVKRPMPAFEFVAERGDVAIVHHLLCHSGNPGHSPNRRPRVALRIEAFAKVAARDTVDPRDQSPWARSYTADPA